MRLSHAAPVADTKIKKFLKSGVAMLLVMILLLSTVFSLQFSWSADAASNSGQTAYANVSEFQIARWKEVQSAVFKGVNLGDNDAPLTPDQVINLDLEKENGYFNWTETGLTNWGAGAESTKVTAESAKVKHTYGDITANYTVYNVDTPGELRYVLSNLNTISGDYIKVNLNADLDMSGRIWDPINLQFCKDAGYKKYLYFEGNGHTIYNLKVYNPDTGGYTSGAKAAGIFSTPPAFMVWKNTGFMSSMVVNDEYGDMYAQSALLCAFLPQKMYLYNVHSSVAYFQNNDGRELDSEDDNCDSAGGIGGLVGRKNIVINPTVDWKGMQFTDCGDTFFENCSTEKQYMYGEDHIGGFSSFMSTKSQANDCSYDSEFPATPEQYVFDADFVDKLTLTTSSLKTDTEIIIKESSSYPIMLKNCSSTDSTVFSVGHDSGAFISCGGGIYANGCFTNNTLYSSDNSGGFIGRIQSLRAGDTQTSVDGFMMDENGDYTVGAVFRDCYSSGIVEGKVAMGGFIGLDNGRRSLKEIHKATSDYYQTYNTLNVRSTIFENCYSTAMVGMDYAGKYVGGFIGLDDNYNDSTTVVTEDGKKITTKGNVYANCYAAGEVGNILTVTDTNEDTLELEDDYLKNYENVDTTKMVLDYYPTGGFIGGLGVDNFTHNYAAAASGYFHNCYYDKQTTAMHEMAVGFSSVKTSNGAANEKFALPGVTGVYTQYSEKKGVNGLTDTVYMHAHDGLTACDSWQYVNEYYPQLNVFMASDISKSDLSDVTSSDITSSVTNSEFYIEDSDDKNEYSKPVLSLGGSKCTSKAQAQMAQVMRAYRESQASTSTVLLDHWDVTMDTTTGHTGEETTPWEINPENALTQYYVDKTTGEIVGTVVYYDADGKEVPYGSGATKKAIKSKDGKVLATLSVGDTYWKNADGATIASVTLVSELSNTIDEWRITYTGLDAGQYEFKVKEGLHTSQANTFGKYGYNDTDNIIVNIPYDNCDTTFRFHFDEIQDTYYYVYADYSNASTSKTTELLASSNGNSDAVRALYVRGSFNDWLANDASKLSYVGEVAGIGTKVYQYIAELDAGTYEFKVADAGWKEEYGQPNGSNMVIVLGQKDEVVFSFDDETDQVSVSSLKEGSITQAALNKPSSDSSNEQTKIDFEGYSVIAPTLITGFDWLESGKELAAAEAGAMTLNAETGLYEKTFTVYEYAYQGTVSRYNATYGYKVIKDGVDTGDNQYFYLDDHIDESDDTIEVTFHYNAETGESFVTTDDKPNKDDVIQYPYKMSYHVAGDEGLTGNNWLVDYQGQGEMNYDSATQTYTKTYTSIPAGTYQFKVVGNGTWDSGLSFGERNSKENYKFELTSEADVTIYFDVVTGLIQVVTVPESALVTKEYVVTGTGNLMGVSWDKKEAVMTYDESTGFYVYTIKNVQPNNNYAFKVIEKNVDTGDNIPFRVEYSSAVDIKVTYDPASNTTKFYAIDTNTGKDVTDEAITDVAIDHWSVLGDESLTGYDWGIDIYDQIPADEAGRMEKSVATADDAEFGVTKGDVLWTKIFTNVEAPYGEEVTYSFKVVANGLWDTGISYGKGGLNGDNLQVTVLSSDPNRQNVNIKVVFNETTKETYYTVTPEEFLTEVNKEWSTWVIYSNPGFSTTSSRQSDPLVYDTVRDITREFTFTSGASSTQRGVTWNTNDDLNEDYGFKSDVQFGLDYSVKGISTAGEFNSEVVDLEAGVVKDNGDKYTGTVTSSVARDQLIAKYTVSDFAPGKAWITVKTLGYGYSDEYIDWKKDIIQYGQYLDALDEYNAVKSSFTNVLSGFEYTDASGNVQTVTAKKDNVVEYCNYMIDGGNESIYNNLAEKYGDLLELKSVADSLYVENPGNTPAVTKTGEVATGIAGQNIYGKRHLRLIPTVYLEAGVDAKISVIQSDNVVDEEAGQTVENIVRVNNSTIDGNVSLSNKNSNSDVSNNIYTKYNLALSAGYLITDKIGMGIYKNYDPQTIVKYGNNGANELRDDLDVAQRTDNRYFAMSTVFTENQSYTDNYKANGSGDADDTYNNGIAIDKLIQQEAIGSALGRGEKVAQTKVQVYKKTFNDDGTVSLAKVVMDSTEGATGEFAENYQKWVGGDAQFTTKDIGTYEVVFYWVMSDGRYLQDSKEVIVSSITSGLTKAVDINYTTAGENKEITYTLTYVNDGSANSLNYALFDVLPYQGDYRLGRGTPSIDKKTDASVESIKLKSINIAQSGGSIVKGIYYTTDKDVRDYTRDAQGNEVANAAEKLGMESGRITKELDKWYEPSTNNKDALTYANGVYSINAEDVTALAITGTELLPGQTIQIEYTIVCDMEIGDYLVNNSYYHAVDVEGGIEKSDYSNHVFTLAVGRHLEGYVWNDLDKDGIVDDGEPFFTNMKTSLYKLNEKTGEYEFTGKTDVTGEDGKYRYENLDDGSYIVIFNGPDSGDYMYTTSNEAMLYSSLSLSKVLTEFQVDGFETETGYLNSQNIAVTDTQGLVIIDPDTGKAIEEAIFIGPKTVATGADIYNDYYTTKTNEYKENGKQTTYMNQNVALVVETSNSVTIKKQDQNGNPMSGVDFVLEKKQTSEDGKETWTPVYFSNNDGKLTQVETAKSYDEIDAHNASMGKYSIVGKINGVETTNGEVLVDNTVTLTFDEESEIFVSSTDRTATYYFDEECTAKTGTLTKAESGARMVVPAGTHTFYIGENEDGTLVLSYAENATEVVPGVTVDNSKKLYLDAGADWNKDGAWFAVCLDDTKWIAMTATEGYDNMFECVVPDGNWKKVVFCRMSYNLAPSALTTIESDKVKSYVWNKTNAAEISDKYDMFKINDPWNETKTGKWINSSETFAKYTYKYLFTTDTEGVVNVEGLSDGSYRFKEVTAPAGYDKLKSAVYFDLPYEVKNITVDNEGNVVSDNDNTFLNLGSTMNDEHLVYYKNNYDEDGNLVSVDKSYNHVTFEVTDPNYQFILPNTGFTGMFIALIIGFALLASGMVFIILSKKKRETSFKH